MANEQQDHHVGGTSGAESEPASESRQDDDVIPPGAGAIEIPIGVPVTQEEFARLKEQARRPRQEDEEHAAEQGQEDSGQHDTT